MRIGAIFPQTEFGNDPAALRDYAQQAEGLGFSHILAYEHVLGARPDREGGLSGPYTYQDPFHEPFVLFGFMAAVTQTIEFITGIVILPQRQTALVAKQAATLDRLSQGRFRLGIGIGWNHVEYLSLNQDFHTRGRRVEEQIALLRRLWTEPLVTFSGRWDNIPEAGLNPLPLQRPIPIWFGGGADAVLRRLARMGDGWLPNAPPYHCAADAQRALETLDRYLEEAGRSRSDIGLEPRIYYGDGNPEVWSKLIEDWEASGATHITLHTMGLGLETPSAHLKTLSTFVSATIGSR